MKICNLLATFESVSGTLRYDHSNKTSEKYFLVIIYTEVIVNFFISVNFYFFIVFGYGNVS